MNERKDEEGGKTMKNKSLLHVYVAQSRIEFVVSRIWLTFDSAFPSKKRLRFRNVAAAAIKNNSENITSDS